MPRANKLKATKFSVKEKIRSLSRGVRENKSFKKFMKDCWFEGGSSDADFPVPMTQIYDIYRKDKQPLLVNLSGYLQFC